MRTRFLHLGAAASWILLGTLPASAQQLPSNATIQGSYNFRYLGADTTSASSPIVMSALGTLTFDGTTDTNGLGKYTVSGTQLKRVNGADQTVSLSSSGTYFVLSSGTFYMDSPFANVGIYGGVGAGPIIVGSGTDSLDCDLFAAIPAAANVSTATLSGNYFISSLEFQGGQFALSRDAFFPVTADGKGSLGNVTVSGTAVNLGNNATTQQISGATYSAGNGSFTLNLPAPGGAANTILLSGTKTMYVSADGNFFMAGGASSYDMILGVKAISGTAPASLSGQYFTALLQNDSTVDNLGGGVYASQGAATELGTQGLELAYERANPSNSGFSYDYTYQDTFQFKADGTTSYTASTYAEGAGGNIVIGTGLGSLYQLNVYVKLPALSGSGVFLNPAGIVNAASNAPFEAQVSPGEFITLYGTGLLTQAATATTLPFPATLGNVQVTIDGTAMPLYYVSPTQISAIVPYTAQSNGNFVAIQVSNNGTASNTVYLYSGLTSPGVFTYPTPGGIGNGAILHQDGSTIVTSGSPAKIGETVSIFLSGLGTVNSNVAAGAAGPSNPLATLINSVDVYIDGLAGTVTYQGLAPTLAGLYQLNVTIPAGVTTPTGSATSVAVNLDISTADAYNSQATIPIGK